MFEVIMLIGFISAPLYYMYATMVTKRPQPMAVRRKNNEHHYPC
jgi:hypothetical protein